MLPRHCHPDCCRSPSDIPPVVMPNCWTHYAAAGRAATDRYGARLSPTIRHLDTQRRGAADQLARGAAPARPGILFADAPISGEIGFTSPVRPPPIPGAGRELLLAWPEVAEALAQRFRRRRPGSGDVRRRHHRPGSVLPADRLRGRMPDPPNSRGPCWACNRRQRSVCHPARPIH